MRWVMSVTMGTALACAATAVAAPLKIERKTLEAKSAAYEIKAEYPRTGVKAIDDELSAWVGKQVADFKKEAAPEQDSELGAWTLDIGYEVERNDADALALLFTLSSYTGGAHGSHGFVTYNFLLPEGARVDLAQVLEGKKGLARLSERVIADLSKQLSRPDDMPDVEWIKRGAGPDWSNYGNVLLLPDALKIEFEEYQVAAYAYGPQEVSVPLSALADVLRKDRRAPVASFDCAKAATPVEHAVCGDAALARLDREIAQAYGQRLGDVEAASDKDAIRAAQRAWLDRRNAACKDQSDAALGACLTGVYRTRLAELSAPP